MDPGRVVRSESCWHRRCTNDQRYESRYCYQACLLWVSVDAYDE